MISPKDWLKWVRGFIVLYESPKNSWVCVVCQMKFAPPNMLCGTLVLCADFTNVAIWPVFKNPAEFSVVSTQQPVEQRAGVTMWSDGSWYLLRLC